MYRKQNKCSYVISVNLLNSLNRHKFKLMRTFVINQTIQNCRALKAFDFGPGQIFFNLEKLNFQEFSPFLA